MTPDELIDVFDRQAATYDKRSEKIAPLRAALIYVLESLFDELPADARILCVGVGTGVELEPLARRFPQWTFTCVEPSGPMLDVCRQRAARAGFAERCRFHQGFLDSLPPTTSFDAATCFLVSQFVLDQDARRGFFRGIADRLRVGGMLASCDLAADTASDSYDALLKAWVRMMGATDASAEALARTRAAYERDVAVLPPARVAAIIEAGGFEEHAQIFQAGLLHAWWCRRA
jgi:tRNA (cmo5U34)-methyltransferase